LEVRRHNRGRRRCRDLTWYNRKMSSSLCLVEKCESKTIAKNLCQYHYDRKRRYGNTESRPKDKICNDCGIQYPVRKTGNLPTVCDSCFTERHRQRQRADRRRKGLWEKYKITLDEYQILYKKQNGVCAICSKTTNGRGKENNTLAVDHNHQTGKIRGLLCTNCNTGIGNLRDSVELLTKAIKYLEERDK
jgi:hypothetical protein